jgi:hypothetical protein
MNLTEWCINLIGIVHTTGVAIRFMNKNIVKQRAEHTYVRAKWASSRATKLKSAFFFWTRKGTTGANFIQLKCKVQHELQIPAKLKDSE